ncbi:serine hydrolase domain-containing protein [Roseococcus sp.]|uniref:serine hydrolase domain-containing protein n=1 Tax=Roseococcus sp. TaxID=2109646 RepID=UPI003BAA996C
MNTIEARLRAAVEARRVPGVVALAATRDGTVFEGAYGVRGLADPSPMTADTVFALASMTKAVTSVAAMQLVEAGRIRLDDPASVVLPEMADPQVLEGFDTAGQPILRPARGAVTLRHLLTHTAGYGYDSWDPAIDRYMEVAGLSRTRRSARGLPLLFDPGTAWRYGINTDLVGQVVEAVSGLTLGEYFRERILGPLGMTDTGFAVPAGWRSRLAGRHQRGTDGTLAPTPFDPPETPEVEGGGGGLFGTGPDYLRFARMLLQGGTLDGVRILAPETVAEMGRNQVGGIEVAPLPASHFPGRSNVADFFPGIPTQWGLGFLLNTAGVPGRRAANSLAWGGINNTYYWIDPASGVTGVLLAQLMPFADPAVLELFGEFEAGVYAAL